MNTKNAQKPTKSLRRKPLISTWCKFNEKTFAKGKLIISTSYSILTYRQKIQLSRSTRTKPVQQTFFQTKPVQYGQLSIAAFWPQLISSSDELKDINRKTVELFRTSSTFSELLDLVPQNHKPREKTSKVAVLKHQFYVSPKRGTFRDFGPFVQVTLPERILPAHSLRLLGISTIQFGYTRQRKSLLWQFLLDTHKYVPRKTNLQCYMPETLIVKILAK